MKKIMSLLVALCMFTGTILPAYAVEPAESEPSQSETQKSSIPVVATYEELVTAIEAAGNGDTIALSQTIYIDGQSLTTDKDITIVRTDDFNSGAMFSISGSYIAGFRFQESISAESIYKVLYSQESTTEFDSCIFDGGTNGYAISIFGGFETTYVTITDCEFVNCFENSINAKAKTYVTMENCYVHNTQSSNANGAVRSSGILNLINCTITQNTSWANAGVMSTDTLTITNCIIKDNTILSPEKGVAVDIFCNGTLNITDAAHDGAGYYDITTGTKLELPYAAESTTAKLIYLSDDKATEYFAPASPPEGESNPPIDYSENVPSPDDTEDDSRNPPETDDSLTPPVPNEPTSPENSDKDDNNRFPLNPYLLYLLFLRNQQSKTEPELPEPAPEPEPIIEPSPALICGNAVIDTSRSVVLEGYGDGQVHLEDALTRAQMATIIYRLLDADSIAQLERDGAIFNDVSPDAWYYPYVILIANAGIVNGTGNNCYSPDAPLTWGHILTVMTRFVPAEENDLQHIQYDGWALPAIQTAVALGWIDDTADLDPDSPITRGEFVEFVNSILERYR